MGHIVWYGALCVLDYALHKVGIDWIGLCQYCWVNYWDAIDYR